MSSEIEEGVAALDFHVWNPTTRLCACGTFFEATSASVPERKRHIVREILRAYLTDLLSH
jgi:hypothetical protein